MTVPQHLMFINEYSLRGSGMVRWQQVARDAATYVDWDPLASAVKEKGTCVRSVRRGVHKGIASYWQTEAALGFAGELVQRIDDAEHKKYECGVKDSRPKIGTTDKKAGEVSLSGRTPSSATSHRWAVMVSPLRVAVWGRVGFTEPGVFNIAETLIPREHSTNVRGPVLGGYLHQSCRGSGLLLLVPVDYQAVYCTHIGAMVEAVTPARHRKRKEEGFWINQVARRLSHPDLQAADIDVTTRQGRDRFIDNLHPDMAILHQQYCQDSLAQYGFNEMQHYEQLQLTDVALLEYL